MSSVREPIRDHRDLISLPGDLAGRLYAFRRRVWLIKIIEAICGAIVGVLVGYLLLFTIDRLAETPVGVRYALLTVAVVASAAVPVAFHRWIWRHRGLDQVARLVSRRFPGIGDQLLGIIELVRDAGSTTAVGINR